MIINPYTYSSADIDPYFSSVVLLLLGNGANGSTTFTDSSSYARTVTPHNGPTISTAQAQFGTSSMLFDGIDDYLSCATGSDFEFPGDFTVEAWVRVGNNVSSKPVYSCSTHQNISTHGFLIEVSGLVPDVYVDGVKVINAVTGIVGGVWTHLALSRSGTSAKLFVDGTQMGSTWTTSTNFSDGVCIIGGDSSSDPTSDNYNAYIDSLRVTKGVARYTSNFTRPITPFPSQ